MEQLGQVLKKIVSFFGDFNFSNFSGNLDGLDATSPLLSAINLVIRFLLPALAVIIIFRCTKSLLRGKQEPEVWAYMGLPNGSRVPLYHWENVIGRAKSSDVVLDYPTLSRSHCAVIRNEKGLWTAIDLESKGGVYINNKKIDGSSSFHEGDVLTLGGVNLALKELDPEEVKTQNRQRTKPGRFITPSGTIFFITIFQLLLCAQLCISAGSNFTVTLPLSFLCLTGMMWIYFFVVRAMRRTGFEIESFAFLLSSIGLAVVATSNPSDLMKQILLTGCGIVGFIIICWILRDLNIAKKLRWPISILGIAVLAVGYLLGSVVFGAKNWIVIGGISLQPSEFVKIAFVFAGAATLDRLFAKRNLILFVGYTGMCLGILALMSDFGTAAVFFVVFLIIAFLRSGDIATIVLSIAAAVFGIFLILMIKPYVAQRFATWGNAWSNPYDAGMQQVRTMESLASGGFFGLGAGRGVLHSVTAADTDMVFGLVCEELGLIIGLCTIASILIMALFTVKSAATSRSTYYVITAGASITIMMAQIILNVFGSLDIIPFTGVTFPFISKGGSSLISCWCLLAFIKAIDTRQNASFAIKLRKRKKVKKNEEYDEYEGESEYENNNEYEDDEYYGTDYYEDPYPDDDDDFEGVDERFFDDHFDKLRRW